MQVDAAAIPCSCQQHSAATADRATAQQDDQQLVSMIETVHVAHLVVVVAKHSGLLRLCL